MFIEKKAPKWPHEWLVAKASNEDWRQIVDISVHTEYGGKALSSGQRRHLLCVEFLNSIGTYQRTFNRRDEDGKKVKAWEKEHDFLLGCIGHSEASLSNEPMRSVEIALKKAAAISLRDLGLSYNAIGKKLSIEATSARSFILKNKNEDR